MTNQHIMKAMQTVLEIAEEARIKAGPTCKNLDIIESASDQAAACETVRQFIKENFLTQEKLDTYVNTDDTTCPFCNSDMNYNGHYGDRELVGNCIYHEVTCGTCGVEWSDIYELVGIAVNNEEHFAYKSKEQE